MSPPFRIAFFSDPHLGPPPRLGWRELANKRITGLINWRLTRATRHDMAALDRIAADMLGAKPDHILCGGDLANIGAPAEFEAARDFLRRFGDPARVSLVPGNHSLYVAGVEGAMFKTLAPWMTGDGERAPAFPFVRRRGPMALIGLNSAAPMPPFDATGRLGETQIEAALLLLMAMKAQGLCRVIAIHHPPDVGGAKRDRRLRDAAAFEAMLAEAGAELVLHGHNHVTRVAHRPGPDGRVPILGAGSASERDRARGRRPCWILISIGRGERGGWTISAHERALDENGAMIERALDLA